MDPKDSVIMRLTCITNFHIIGLVTKDEMASFLSTAEKEDNFIISLFSFLCTKKKSDIFNFIQNRIQNVLISYQMQQKKEKK